MSSTANVTSKPAADDSRLDKVTSQISEGIDEVARSASRFSEKLRRCKTPWQHCQRTDPRSSSGRHRHRRSSRGDCIALVASSLNPRA